MDICFTDGNGLTPPLTARAADDSVHIQECGAQMAARHLFPLWDNIELITVLFILSRNFLFSPQTRNEVF